MTKRKRLYFSLFFVLLFMLFLRTAYPVSAGTLLNTDELPENGVEGVRISSERVNLKFGESTQLTAEVYPEGAQNKSVTWKSSEPRAATVNERGKVIAVAATGSAIISVTTVEGNFSAYCEVTMSENEQSGNRYTVIFDTMGGSYIAPYTDCLFGLSINAPLKDPYRPWYEFGGWYKDARCTTPYIFEEEPITGDTRIYAKWISSRNELNIHMDEPGTLQTLVEAAMNEKGFDYVAFLRVTGHMNKTDFYYMIGRMPRLLSADLSEVILPAQSYDSIYFTGPNCNMIKVVLPALPNNYTNFYFTGNEMIQEVVLPNNLKYIPAFCFSGCERLNKLVLPDSLLKIEKTALDNCDSLEVIELSKNLSIIGYAQWTNVHTIIINNETDIVLVDEELLTDFDKVKYVYVPDHFVSAYKSTNTAWRHLRDKIYPISKIQYKVLYRGANGGSSLPVDNYKYRMGDTITVLGSQAEVGKVFLGWICSVDGKYYGMDDTFTIEGGEDKYPNNTIVFEGRWADAANVVRVYFETDMETEIRSQLLVRGNVAIEPDELVRENYIFEGWYRDADFTELWNFNYEVLEDMTLYAKWTERDPSKDVNIHNTVAGELSIKLAERMSEEEFVLVESLEITGKLYMNDLMYIAQNFPALKKLDLLTAKIHEGSVPARWLEQNTVIEEVILPKSINTIQTSAFYGCTGLVRVQMPENLMWLEAYAFYGCEALTEIILPNGLVFIGSNVFEDCIGLEAIEIPNGVEHILSGTFRNCSSLQAVKLGDETGFIHEEAFAHCGSLSSFTFSSKVSYIGVRAFAYCVQLYDMHLPDSVDYIDYEAFLNCNLLNHLLLPEKVGNLSGRVFAECGELTIILANRDYVVSYNTELSMDPFSNTDIKVYVPDSLLVHYETADGWSERTEILYPLSSFGE